MKVQFLELSLALFEFVLLAILFVRISYVIKNFKASDNLYTLDRIEASIGNGKTSYFLKFVVQEFLVVYYALFGWFIRPMKVESINYRTFTHHKKGKQGIMMILLVFLAFIEIPLLHLLLGLWNDIIAWIVTFLGLYSLLWLIGDYNLTRLNPIILGNEQLYLRIGIRWKADIPIKHIENTANYEKNDEILKLSLGLSHNIIVNFSQPIEFESIFGLRKWSKSVALALDKPESFKLSLQANLN